MKEIAPRIVINPNVRFGKPVIRGTRVPVDLIVGKVAGGVTINEICEQYGVTAEDVYAALRYAAELVKQEQVMHV